MMNLRLRLHDDLVVVIDFKIKAFDGALQLFELIKKFDALLDENFSAALGIVVILHERDVLDERLDLDASASHTLDEGDPLASFLVEISDAVFLTRDIRQQSDALIITDGIGSHAEFFTDLANSH